MRQIKKITLFSEEFETSRMIKKTEKEEYDTESIWDREIAKAKEKHSLQLTWLLKEGNSNHQHQVCFSFP